MAASPIGSHRRPPLCFRARDSAAATPAPMSKCPPVHKGEEQKKKKTHQIRFRMVSVCGLEGIEVWLRFANGGGRVNLMALPICHGAMLWIRETNLFFGSIFLLFILCS